MCNIIDNIDKFKKDELKLEKEKIYLRQLNLVKTLGEPSHKFRIIDELEMTPDMIENFELAIKSGVPGRPPKKTQVISNPTFGDKYAVMYRYDKRSDVDGPKVLPNGRTRTFCVDVLDASRYYTRENITTLSNGFGLSVFKYAGGYWTQPDGSVSPQCRHTWVMMFVEKK